MLDIEIRQPVESQGRLSLDITRRNSPFPVTDLSEVPGDLAPCVSSF
jgi:hypothetical protein